MRVLPSLRQKKRYVVFEVHAAQRFSLAEIKEEVEQAWQLFLGQWGVAQASPILIPEQFSSDQQRFILKVNHRWVDPLKAALSLSTKIKNTSATITSVIVSGTLKKASLFLNKKEARKGRVS